jgi:hypothetical protein
MNITHFLYEGWFNMLRKLFLIIFLISVIVVGNNYVWAGPEQSDYSSDTELEFIIRGSDQEGEDEVSTLNDEKEKVSNDLKRKLFKLEEKKYKDVIVIFLKLIYSLDGHTTCRGGQNMVNSAADILDKLVIIHKQEVYGSLDKENKLEQLFKDAQKNYGLLQNAPKKVFNLQLNGHYERETRDFFSILSRGEKEIKIAGPDVDLGYGVVPGIGLRAGRSKTPYGIRRAVIGCKVGGHCGGGFFSTIGYNSIKTKSGIKLFGNAVGTAKAGFLIAGGLDSGYTYKSSYEGGVGLGGLFLGGDLIGGLEFWSLPVNLKCFQKSAGLTPEKGTLPDYLKREIKNAKNKEELKQKIS